MKTKALGRGLGNLIPLRNKETGNNEEQPGNSNLKEIKISEIKLNPNQPRKTFSPDSISELSETIKQHGIIQPIVVIKRTEGYELVSGERRLRACKEAGFHKIPAIIKNYSDNESLEISIIENIQREDLNPIEEALAYYTLSEKLKLKISQIAERLGKNRSTIANLIRLLQLPDSIKELIKTGKLSEGQARPILSLGDKKQQESLANKIVENGMTVREIEEYVSKLSNTSKSKQASNKKIDPIISNFESKLRNKLSAKVQIGHNQTSGRGKITINYNNVEEMEKILEIIGVK